MSKMNHYNKCDSNPHNLGKCPQYPRTDAPPPPTPGGIHAVYGNGDNSMPTSYERDGEVLRGFDDELPGSLHDPTALAKLRSTLAALDQMIDFYDNGLKVGFPVNQREYLLETEADGEKPYLKKKVKIDDAKLLLNQRC